MTTLIYTRVFENMVKKGKWISSQLCISEVSFICNLYCEYCHNPPDGRKHKITEILKLVNKEKPYIISIEGKGKSLTNHEITRDHKK